MPHQAGCKHAELRGGGNRSFLRRRAGGAAHPGGPRVLSFVQMALGLPKDVHEASRQILAEHGNMSSPTILFILERLRRQNAKRPCVALGFGPGLMAEAALLR